MGMPVFNLEAFWVVLTERPLLVVQAIILGVVFYGLIYFVIGLMVRRFDKFPAQHAMTIFWGAVAALTLLIVAIYGFIGAKIAACISLLFFGITLFRSLEINKNSKPKL